MQVHKRWYVKGKSAEGDGCLKPSAWAYTEQVYDCHRLDGALQSKNETYCGIVPSGGVPLSLSLTVYRDRMCPFGAGMEDAYVNFYRGRRGLNYTDEC